MWYLILCLIVLIALTIWLCRGEDLEDKIGIFFGIWALGGGILAGLGIPVLRLTTGFYENYSVGQREGYITKLAEKGFIFKTWEGQLQVGTGQMAALQEPWAFSVPDKLAPVVEGSLGKRVTIHYTQFLLMPWRYGETQYLVTSVVPAE